MNSVIHQLTSHRSIRKFTNQQVEQDVVENIVEAGQGAATSSFLQACTVIQINEDEKRVQLASWAGEQAYVEQAPVFLIFCADMERHRLACEMHSAPMQSGFTEQFLTASLDCALFAQNVMVAAESLGLGGCYIGGLRNEIKKVGQLLELPQLVYPVFGLCLGYPAQNPEVKPRLPLSVVLKQETYSAKEDQQQIGRYDQEVEGYYRTRTGGNKVMSWSGQISAMLVKEARPHMLAYLQEKGFLLR